MSLRPALSLLHRTPLAGVVAFLVVMLSLVMAEQSIAQGNAATKKDPSTTEQTRFAPGVVQVIPPSPEAEETFDGPMTLKTLLDAYPEIQFGGDTHQNGEPHFDPRTRTLAEMARQVILRREIYCFEFAFKPLRHVYIDIPRTDGALMFPIPAMLLLMEFGEWRHGKTLIRTSISFRLKSAA